MIHRRRGERVAGSQSVGRGSLGRPAGVRCVTRERPAEAAEALTTHRADADAIFFLHKNQLIAGANTKRITNRFGNGDLPLGCDCGGTHEW